MTLKLVVSFAFVGSIALTLLLLSCTIDFKEEAEIASNYWVLFGTRLWPIIYGVIITVVYFDLFQVIAFYVLAPIPLALSRAMDDGSGSTLEVAVFFSMGFIVSAFALPIVLANRDVIQWSSCGLSMAANIVMFGTIGGIFRFFGDGDEYFGYNQFSL